jgi:DnaJ-class molecular chaperone
MAQMKDCPACKGSGNCQNCGGDGKKGPWGLQNDCPRCKGTGKCTRCNGKGAVPMDKK